MTILISIMLAIIIMGSILGLMALAAFRTKYFVAFVLICTTLCIASAIYSELR